MRTKNDINEILDLKLENRVCRKKIDAIPVIMEIIQDCCDYLQMPIPKVLFCESLSKDFQSFILRGQSYFIYDACLLEAMSIITTCALAGFLDTDMEKLFMKLIAEELIVSRDLSYALYFVGHYHRKQYSFENRVPAFEKCNQYLSFQNYFLISHELTHLSLMQGRIIPTSFKEFIINTICSLMERYSGEDRPFGNNLHDYSMYFFQKNQDTMDDFLNALPDSIHFQHLLEESYCDYIGLKILVENYALPGVAMNAIFSALNFLIDIEVIRDELRNGLLKRDTPTVFGEASITTFFSMLRMGIASYVSHVSNLTNVMIQDYEIQWESSTDRLADFLKQVPDGKSFAKIADIELPKDEKSVVSYLIRQLYYSSVS